MKSLPEINDANEDAILAAIDDDSRPIMERTKMWFQHHDTNVGRAIMLLVDLAEYTEALETRIAKATQELEGDD